MLATAYVRRGNATLVSIASWAAGVARCELHVDLAALGLEPQRAHVRAPLVEGFQTAIAPHRLDKGAPASALNTHRLDKGAPASALNIGVPPLAQRAAAARPQGRRGSAFDLRHGVVGAPAIDVEPGKGWLLLLEAAPPASALPPQLARARAAAWAAAALVEVPQHTPDAEVM